MKNNNNNDIMDKLADDILKRKEGIRSLENTLRSAKEDLRGIEDQFRSALSEKGLRSISYGSHYLATAARKYVSITDLKALMTQLKKKGMKDCIVEAVDKRKFDVYAKEALKTGKMFAGTEVKESEYLVVREKKEK